MVSICITTINNLGDIYLPSVGITMVSVISVIYDQEYTFYPLKLTFNCELLYVQVSGIVCRESNT